MSELVQAAAVTFLAECPPVRRNNLLRSVPATAGELRVNWLPSGWSLDAERLGLFGESLKPDSQAAAEAVQLESSRREKALDVWATLDPQQQANLLAAAKNLASESEPDLRATLADRESVGL